MSKRAGGSVVSVERAATEAGTPHQLTSLVTSLHRQALARFGAVDGELMAPALLEEQAGFRLSGDGHTAVDR